MPALLGGLVLVLLSLSSLLVVLLVATHNLLVGYLVAAGSLWVAYLYYRVAPRERRAIEVVAKGGKQAGYIYFIRGRAEPFWRIKIGRARHIESRLRQHKVSNPYGLVILGISHVRYASQAEARIHFKFRKNRIEREWFYLTPRLFLYILMVRDGELTDQLRRKL